MDLWQLTDLCTPWCVHVVATLRIADHLADGPMEFDKLAAICGADAESLQRVLRHLVSKGLFEEPETGRFALNDATQALREERTRMWLDLRGFGGRMAYAWGTLLSAVQTGRPAYHEAFRRSFWDDLDANPEIAASFDEGMGPAGHGIPDANILINELDWPSVHTVADIGGGTGALLAEVLRARPHVHGTLVDLPRTVARSDALFQAAGVADRVSVVGQSFFDPLPAGLDVYLLKSVMGDWPNREVVRILTRCAEAARPSGRVVILSGIVPGEVAGPELLMMVLVGGKDRTLDEFQPLAREAGLEVRASGSVASGRFVVECRPVANW
jgi:SAM-dependent methyltransferase